MISDRINAIAAVNELRETVFNNQSKLSKHDEIIDQFKKIMRPLVPTWRELIEAGKDCEEKYNDHDRESFDFGQFAGITILYDSYLIQAYINIIKYPEPWNISYDELSAVFQLFLEKYPCSYYANTKEDFYLGDAAALAKRNNHKYVIAENLS